MKRLPAVLCLSLLAACHGRAQAPGVATRTGLEFLDGVTRAWPSPTDDTRLVSVSPGSDRVAIYDNALAVLVDVRVGRHAEAARILNALTRVQREDGSLPFSFDRDDALDAPAYVRSGAMAWVGFASVTWLDADRGGEGRDAIARMAHEIARYLIAHQVQSPGDPRDGLVTGGGGTLSFDKVDGKVKETFAPKEIPWASTEHNIDAFFFLRALARLSANRGYQEAADRIAHALAARAWGGSTGQLDRGAGADGVDPVLALDCASWGALFFLALGDHDRAETSYAVADVRYATDDPRRGTQGHRPYARGLVLEGDEEGPRDVAAGTWEASKAVWPEGSAGVALAALRLGYRDRAAAILKALEPLRDPSGGLPTMTEDVPFAFDTLPSVAGTAWVELVRQEIDHPTQAPLVWPK